MRKCICVCVFICMWVRTCIWIRICASADVRIHRLRTPTAALHNARHPALLPSPRPQDQHRWWDRGGRRPFCPACPWISSPAPPPQTPRVGVQGHNQSEARVWFWRECTHNIQCTKWTMPNGQSTHTHTVQSSWWRKKLGTVNADREIVRNRHFHGRVSLMNHMTISGQI